MASRVLKMVRIFFWIQKIILFYHNFILLPKMVFHVREVQKRISPKHIFPLESAFLRIFKRIFRIFLRIFCAFLRGFRAHFFPGPYIYCIAMKELLNPAFQALYGGIWKSEALGCWPCPGDSAERGEGSGVASHVPAGPPGIAGAEATGEGAEVPLC